MEVAMTQASQSVFISRLVPAVKKWTEKAIDYLAVILFAVLFIFGLAQVIWRWVFNNPITWTEESINILYVWVCYLGWVIAESKDSHIRITAVVNKFPANVQKYIQVFNHLLCILFCILMVYYGFKMTAIGAKRTTVSFTMSYAVVYVIGPVSNLIIMVYEIAQMIEVFVKGPKDYSDEKVGLEE